MSNSKIEKNTFNFSSRPLFETIKLLIFSPLYNETSTAKQVLGNRKRMVFASLIGNRLSTYANLSQKKRTFLAFWL